jgi:hypothetical protein
MKNILWIFVFIIICSCRTEESSSRFAIIEEEPSQIFEVAADRDTTMIGKKGTIVMIKANSFVTDKGKTASGIVRLTVKEFYTIDDFINNRLSTKTVDGKLLRSSGMLFLEATSGATALKVKEDSPLTLKFRKVQKSNTANLFRGVRSKAGEMRWELLDPVHNDTIVIRTEKITAISYGEETVEINVRFLIGKDTIDITEENRADFDNVLFRGEMDSVAGSFGDSDAYYIFQTANLGYLNCDIFIEDQLEDMVISPGVKESDVFMVLDSLNAVFFPDSVNRTTNEYYFRIPDGVAITAISYRKENDAHFFGKHKARSRAGSLTLTPQERTMDEIRQEIKALAGQSSIPRID